MSDVNIDLTDPVVTFTGNAGTYNLDDRVTTTCSTHDVLSGLIASSCESVDEPAHDALGTTTLNAFAQDRARNVTIQNATFTVTASTDSACALVERFVSHRGIAHSLCAKLRSAQASGARQHDRARQPTRGVPQGGGGAARQPRPRRWRGRRAARRL